MESARLKRRAPPDAETSQIRSRRFTQVSTKLSRAEVKTVAERFGLTHDQIAALEFHDAETEAELKIAALAAGREANALIDFLTFLVRSGNALPGRQQEPFEDL
jgi:hypothetical protein